MDELYRSYLNFLRSMCRGLESLTELNVKKLAAAQQDDLMGLNELLNQEQAQALLLPTVEQVKALPDGPMGEEESEAECSFPCPSCGHHLSCVYAKKNKIGKKE